MNVEFKIGAAEIFAYSLGEADAQLGREPASDDWFYMQGYNAARAAAGQVAP